MKLPDRLSETADLELVSAIDEQDSIPKNVDKSMALAIATMAPNFMVKILLKVVNSNLLLSELKME
jgi:hypothetical protein